MGGQSEERKELMDLVLYGRFCRLSNDSLSEHRYCIAGKFHGLTVSQIS